MKPAETLHAHPVTPEVAGSSPVAPAFDTALPFAATSQFVGCLEVAQECFPRLHRDDRAAVLPDAIEQDCEESTGLRRVVFELEGFQNAGSCCGAVVFVDQSADSVAALDLSVAGWRVRVCRVGREQC